MREPIPLPLQLLSGDLEILYKAKAPIVHNLRHVCRLFVQYIPHYSTVYLSTHKIVHFKILSFFFFFGDSLLPALS